jgi:hypothetical protein
MGELGWVASVDEHRYGSHSFNSTYLIFIELKPHRLSRQANDKEILKQWPWVVSFLQGQGPR